MPLKIEMDPGPRPKDKQAHHTERGREYGFYVVTEDGTSIPIPIGFMRKSEMQPLEDLLNALCAPRLDVEGVIKDLHSQEVYPERHPVCYSPDQVRKTLTRFLTVQRSITVERSHHEIRAQRNSGND